MGAAVLLFFLDLVFRFGRNYTASHDPLKVVFDYLDRHLWMAHPTHGPFFDLRNWFYYEVKEPIHRWAFLSGLTKEKPISLYTVEDLLRVLEVE
jgi:hypothetical protein